MDRSHLRRRLACTADDVLADLSTRQFVRPHRPVAEVLADAADKLGTCPAAAARAAAWLDLDLQTAIGRLTRTQLSQLARSVHRFCRQAHGSVGGGRSTGPGLPAASAPHGV
jgi:hypothetical protein